LHYNTLPKTLERISFKKVELSHKIALRPHLSKIRSIYLTIVKQFREGGEQ